jgi:hypothetical protein
MGIPPAYFRLQLVLALACPETGHVGDTRRVDRVLEWPW